MTQIADSHDYPNLKESELGTKDSRENFENFFKSVALCQMYFYCDKTDQAQCAKALCFFVVTYPCKIFKVIFLVIAPGTSRRLRKTFYTI